MPQIFIGAKHVGGCDELYALEDAGKLDPLLQQSEGSAGMSAASPNSAFQSRPRANALGRRSAANLAPRAAAIEQAAQRAAPTTCSRPEMTNIMEIKRERLFAAITEEESDPTLAALRETARKLSIYLHIGSLAIKVSPDKAANRSFLIDRARRDRRALRQDPHVRRRSGERRKLPRVA